MHVYDISGGGGLRLHVREWGKAQGPPILFIHGWSQCHLYWAPQFESALASEFRLVALDIRGHGMSDKPLEAEHYTSPQLWADDVAAVLGRLALDRPVLVGWSYGGYIICDYLRVHGDSKLGAINFVGAAVELNQQALGTLIGPGFLDHFAGATGTDLPASIEAIRNFLRACTHHPIPAAMLEAALCWNFVVPARVRAALLDRTVSSDDVLKSITVPVLISHGRQDTVVLPSMGERILANCPVAKASWYADAGHCPPLEDTPRFNRELTELVRQSRA